LTAREIGAFLAGSRAAKYLDSAYLTAPELESLALAAAAEDAPIAAAMRLSDYVYWFIRGYELRQRLDGAPSR
jgi:hypothetical protein